MLKCVEWSVPNSLQKLTWIHASGVGVTGAVGENV